MSQESLLKNENITVVTGKELEMAQERDKPRAKFVGKNSHLFSVLEIASDALRKAGLGEGVVKEMQHRAISAGGYDFALEVVFEYVEPY